MPGYLGEEQVRRVKERTDLVQLMGEYTPLRKAGAQFAGCCAFHSERTPSMYVYPDQQTYHCYGCGAHGDAIRLICEKERIEFLEAVELLARRAGIALSYDAKDSAKRSQRDRLLPVVEFAAAFYERVLWESPAAQPARDYLARRRLSEATCRRFRLGWAPGSGALIAEARRRNQPLDLLKVADLATERNGSLGDRFWERITFPITDRFGNPVAFSARLLPEAERKAKEEGRGVGKYINNTDTPLYHKGSVVFNLHRARTASRERGRIVVMEGPTDVMAADQAGYGECVAILGTALTPDHAKQLGNVVGGEGRIYLLLDGDRAGQANGIKGVRTCLSVGVPVRVALLPEELDPAELLAEGQGGDGKAVLERVLAESRQDLDHLLRAIAPRPYDLDAPRRLAAADEVLAAVRAVPDPTLRGMHLRDAADYFGLPRDEVLARATESKAPAASAASQEAGEAPPLAPSEDAVLHILARHPELRAHAADDLGLEASSFGPAWQALAFALLQEENDATALLALPSLRNDAALRASAYRWLQTELAHRPVAIGDARAYLDEHVREIQRRHLRDQLARLNQAVTEAITANDAAAQGRLLGERMAIQHRLATLRGGSEER